MLVQNNTLRAIKYHCIGRRKGSWHFVQQLMIVLSCTCLYHNFSRRADPKITSFNSAGSKLVNRLIMHDLKSCKMLLWSVNSSFNLWFLFHIISELLLGDNVEALHTLIQIVAIYTEQKQRFLQIIQYSPTVQHYVTIHVGRMFFIFNH